MISIININKSTFCVSICNYCKVLFSWVGNELEIMASNSNSDDERDNLEEEREEERDTFPDVTKFNGNDGERDRLPDMLDSSDAGDLASEGRSEGRSVTSEERSIRSMTPDTELEEIEEVLREQPKPKVIVFDLDYTLWPFWVDRQMNIELPFKQVGENKVCDATGREVKSYPDVTPLLQRLHGEGYKIGIASEAFYKDECAKLVKLFGWEEYIDYQEIYPGSKIFHFVKIKRASGVDFCDMMYFDDEKEHLSEVAGTCTGITTVLADRGVSDELVEEGFQTFSDNRQSQTYFRAKPVTLSRRNSTEPFVSLRPLIQLRRRNSIENEITLPPANTILGGAGLSALSSTIQSLHLKDKLPNHHEFNPNLPGLNGPVSGPPRSKQRRRFSIM